MASKYRLGLFKVKVNRTTVRNEPGAFFIGTLFRNDYFYVEHRHAADPTWAWGYGGGEFASFGWVRLAGRFSGEDGRDDLSRSYARKVEAYLKRGKRRRRSIANYARDPQPPPSSTTATRQVQIMVSTPFFLNQSNGMGRSSGRGGVTPSLAPGKKVSWRYLTKGNLHAVVYHPMGRPVFGHGRWGFIRNSSDVKIDPPL